MLGSSPHLTQSKQLYHLDVGGGSCQLLAAHPDLGKYVDYYWLLTITAPQLTLEVIPDTAVDLVLCPDISEFAALYFPTPEKFSIPLRGPVHYAGICFHSATVSELLGLSLADLRQLQVGADAIEQLGIARLTDEIVDRVEPAKLQQCFDRFWLDRLTSLGQTEITRSPITQAQLIALLEDSLGSDSIASVCQSLQLSERQFRRLSNELFGLSPKKIQNVLRLQAALAELFAQQPQQLQDLYYDDSHRIRELKRLTGFTPQQIRLMAEKYNQG